jgi:hypothetical protein
MTMAEDMSVIVLSFLCYTPIENRSYILAIP